MTTQYLVLTDVNAIQSYVFSSIRMAPIVGASRIVQEFDQRLLDLAREKLGSAWSTMEQSQVSSGGLGMFVFPFEMSEQAQQFDQEAPGCFAEASVDGRLTTSGVFEICDDSSDAVECRFAAQRAAALAELDRRKRLGQPQAEPVGIGLGWVCETCGKEPAMLTRPQGNGVWRVGPACQKRLEVRDAGVNLQQRRYYHGSGDAKETTLPFPHDFDELCSGGYWALVVLDGDGLGDRLQQFASPQDFKAFSDRFDAVTRKALAASLRKVTPVDANIAPWLVLFSGGDDIVIACQGHLALSLVDAFATEFAGTTDWSWAGGEPIGFSAGIAIVRQGFPFRTAHHLANGLLASAKRTARKRKWTGGAVDYALVTESIGDVRGVLRERIIESRAPIESDSESINFSGRPYPLVGPLPGRLADLRSTAERLASQNFPTSRLFDLRNQLTRATYYHGDDPSPGELQRAREGVTQFLAGWTSRTCRDLRLKKVWEEAVRELARDDLAGVASFPQADLADAIYLWGFDHAR